MVEVQTRTSKEKSKWYSVKRLELRKARLKRTGISEIFMMEIKSVTRWVDVRQQIHDRKTS